LYLRHYDADGKLQSVFGPRVELEPSSTQELSWRLDSSELDLDGLPIAEVGLEITSEQRANGTIYVDYLTWDGAPDTTFKKRGKMSLQSWVDGADSVETWGSDYRIRQNDGRGLLIQGAREWSDYLRERNVIRRTWRSRSRWRRAYRA
jgi:hypothetical protein